MHVRAADDILNRSLKAHRMVSLYCLFSPPRNNFLHLGCFYVFFHNLRHNAPPSSITGSADRSHPSSCSAWTQSADTALVRHAVEGRTAGFTHLILLLESSNLATCERFSQEDCTLCGGSYVTFCWDSLFVVLLGLTKTDLSSYSRSALWRRGITRRLGEGHGGGM